MINIRKMAAVDMVWLGTSVILAEYALGIILPLILGLLAIRLLYLAGLDGHRSQLPSFVYLRGPDHQRWESEGRRAASNRWNSARTLSSSCRISSRMVSLLVFIRSFWTWVERSFACHLPVLSS